MTIIQVAQLPSGPLAGHGEKVQRPLAFIEMIQGTRVRLAHPNGARETVLGYSCHRNCIELLTRWADLLRVVWRDWRKVTRDSGRETHAVGDRRDPDAGRVRGPFWPTSRSLEQRVSGMTVLQTRPVTEESFTDGDPPSHFPAQPHSTAVPLAPWPNVICQLTAAF